MASLAGMLAMASSLLLIMLGFPGQILLNYKNKSCKGIAPAMVWTVFINYALWGWYGWTEPDIFLIIAETPGFILVGILVWQMHYYRRRKSNVKGT